MAMTSIGHPRNFTYQARYQVGSARHLLMVMLVVTLQIYLSFCEEQVVIKHQEYIFYNSNKNNSKNICIGPFHYVDNYTYICELINCNGMNTSCYNVGCNILKTNGLKNRASGRFPPRQTSDLPLSLVLGLNESKTILSKSNFSACFNNSKKQMDFIKSFDENLKTVGTQKRYPPNFLAAVSRFKSNIKSSTLRPHKPTLTPKNDNRNNLELQSIPNTQHTSSWVSLIAMTSTLTAMVFIAILVFFFYKSKFIKCNNGIDSRPNQESANHDYEDIDDMFPQHSTTDNFYHNSIPISCEDESIQTIAIPDLQTDQTLSRNNEPQDQMAYTVIQRHK